MGKNLKSIAKYGSEAVKLAIAHKKEVIGWGLTAIDIIANLFG